MFNYADYRRYRRYRRWRRRRRLALLLIAITVTAVATQHIAAHPRTASHGRTPMGPATAPARKSTRHTSAAPQARNSGMPSVSWTDFHGIQLPVSAAAGPRHQHNGLARGFADTPLGAVLAAVNIVVRTAAQWGPPVYRPTINHQLTGPGAAALLAADNSDYAAMRAAAHVAPGQPTGRGHAAETAYRLTIYTPAAATADIVTEGPASNGTTVIAITRIHLVWQRRDWRVIAPPGGAWNSSAGTASALRGYTAFPNEG